MTSLWFVLAVVAIVAAGGCSIVEVFRRVMFRIWNDDAADRVRKTRIGWWPR